MPEKLTFPYNVWNDYVPDQMLRPFIPVRLGYDDNEIQTLALLDSGADINVLPYQLGLELGLDWDAAGDFTGLQGLGGGMVSKKSVADLYVGSWPGIRQIFAWARNDEIPVILGQWNFFQEVIVCFHKSRNYLELDLSRG